MSLKIEYFGLTELTFVFSRLQMGKSNVNKMLERATETFYTIMEETFSKNGRHNQWKELTKKYKKRKIKDGYGNLPILQRTKQLKDSLTGKGDIQVTKEGNTISISLPSSLSGRFYGHQTGSSKHGGLPKRTIVDFTEEDSQRIMESMISASPLNRFIAFLGGAR